MSLDLCVLKYGTKSINPMTSIVIRAKVTIRRVRIKIPRYEKISLRQYFKFSRKQYNGYP